MKIKRIEPISLSKVLGIVYALIGLIIGALITIGALLGTAASSGNKLGGLVFGVGAIIVIPIFYGVLGLIGGFIAAWFYNLASEWVGGIEMEVEEDAAVISENK